MRIQLFAACTDGQDGSYSVKLFSTRAEALKKLNRTEEQLSEGCFYEDGCIEEVVLDVDSKGKLKKPVNISIGE